MKVSSVLVLMVVIANIITGGCLMFMTIKYKDKFENYKKELLTDFIVTLIPIICLILMHCIEIV